MSAATQVGCPRGAGGPDPAATSPSQPPALKFTCPETKRLKTFGVTGHAGFFAPQNYGDHHTASVMSFPPPHLQQASGTVYAVCR